MQTGSDPWMPLGISLMSFPTPLCRSAARTCLPRVVHSPDQGRTTGQTGPDRSAQQSLPPEMVVVGWVQFS